MSGGGGGGEWRPEPKEPKSRPKGSGKGGGSSSPPPDPCNITEITSLNSVNCTVVASLRQGDRLAVVFQAGPPRQLIAQTATGAIAGSITSPSMLQIIQCIQTGVAYVAEVLSVRGAQCQVQIQPQ